MRLSEMNSKELLPAIFKGNHDFICEAFDVILKEMAHRARTLRAHGADAFINMTEEEQLQMLRDCGIDWFFADLSPENRADFCSYVVNNLEKLCTKESLEYLLKCIYDDQNIRAEIIKQSACEYTIYIAATSHEVVSWTESIVNRIQQYVMQFWPVHVIWDGRLRIDALETEATLRAVPIAFDYPEDSIFDAVDTIKKPSQYYITIIRNNIRTYYFYGTNTPGAQSSTTLRTLHTVANSGPYVNNVTNASASYRAYLLGSATASIKHCPNYQIYATNASPTNWIVQFPSQRPHDELPNSVRVLMLSYSSIPTAYGLETHDVTVSGRRTIAISMLNTPETDKATRYYCLLSDIDDGIYHWFSLSELLAFHVEFLDETNYINLYPGYRAISIYAGSLYQTYQRDWPISLHSDSAADIVEVFSTGGRQGIAPGQYDKSTNQKVGYYTTNLELPDESWVDRHKLRFGCSNGLIDAAWAIEKVFDNGHTLPDSYKVSVNQDGSFWYVEPGISTYEAIYDKENALEHGTDFAFPVDTWIQWRDVYAHGAESIYPISRLSVAVLNDFTTGKMTVQFNNKTTDPLYVFELELLADRYEDCLAYARSGSYQPANVTLNAGATANTYAPLEASSPGLVYFKNFHTETSGTVQVRPKAFVNRNDVDLGVSNIELVPTQWTNADHVYIRIKNITSAGISWSNVTAQLIV